MRLASVMLIKRIAHPGSARCWFSSGMAESTRKIAMLRCCLGVSGLSPPALLLRTSVSEDDPKKQDRVHLVKLAHLAINARPAGPLTGTYNYLSKNPRANPHEVSRFLHSFQVDISTYLGCYSVDTLCKPLFSKAVLHCTNTPQYALERDPKADRCGAIKPVTPTRLAMNSFNAFSKRFCPQRVRNVLQPSAGSCRK